MKKLLFIITTIMILTCACVDKASQSRTRISQTIDSLNYYCPTSTKLITIDRYSYSHDTIIIKMTINGVYLPFEALKVAYKTEKYDVNFLHYISFVTHCPDPKAMRKDLINSNATIILNFFDSYTSGSYESVISPDEMKKYADRKITNEDRARIRLKVKLVGENCRCPYNVETGISMEKVYSDNRYVTFEMGVDESLYSIEALRQNKNAVKDGLKQTLQQMPKTAAYGDLIAIEGCKLGIKYLYRGTTSNETMSVEFEPKELPTLEEIKEGMNDELGIDIF